MFLMKSEFEKRENVDLKIVLNRSKFIINRFSWRIHQKEIFLGIPN